MQQRRDRPADAVTRTRIVRNATGHEQGAQVGVTQPEGAEEMAVFGDLLRGVAGMVDQQFLGDEEDPAGGLETLRVELPIRLAELHQVDARQVARRIVQEHVFRTRIAGINRAC